MCPGNPGKIACGKFTLSDLGMVAAGHVSLQPLILKKAVENGFEI